MQIRNIHLLALAVLILACMFGCSNTGQSESEKATSGESLAVLDIEAGIDYKMGGVQPITSQTFYLLDSDAEEILKSSVKNHHPGKFGFLSMFGFDAKLIPNSEEHKKALAAIEQHTKYSATTDLHGKAHFTNVRAGAYYIFGFAETRGGYAVWNLNVSLKEGANSQILDAKNAAVAL